MPSLVSTTRETWLCYERGSPMQSIKSPLIPEHEDTINPLGGDGAQAAFFLTHKEKRL